MLSQAVPPGSKHNKSRATNTRDERFRSDLHTEAVHAALAKYKERKMPMPSKRRSVLVQSSVEACTPPGKITLHYPELTWVLNRTTCYPQPIWT
uniref:DMAP1-binding domain-containing protein n=1 Tax=Hucho hucho TaxID=62062 RepID=A0A4W5REW4_9TELE